MSINAVYGTVPAGLVEVAEVAEGSVQCSPRAPGGQALEDLTEGGCARFVMLAPPNAVERRHELALALRALEAGGTLVAMAPNSKGGNRLADELAGFGCVPETSHKRHHQIVHTRRPAGPLPLADAIAAGAPRLLPDLGLWSQPGLFSWDRIDPGSALLLEHLPPLSGRGADLGCGFGVLSRAVLGHADCRHLTLVDIDRRALDMARRNAPRPEAITTLWMDVRRPRELPNGLDFVVMNPPFHDGGEEDRALGRAFIERAAAMLMPGGALWLTANRHLPYEATLGQLFGEVEIVTQAGGYKIFAARKATGREARGRSEAHQKATAAKPARPSTSRGR